MGSEKLRFSMTRNKRCGCSCPGLRNGLGGGGSLRPKISLLLVRGEETALDRCCPSREPQIMEKKWDCGVLFCFVFPSVTEGSDHHLQGFSRARVPCPPSHEHTCEKGIFSAHSSATIPQYLPPDGAGISRLRGRASVICPLQASQIDRAYLTHRA